MFYSTHLHVKCSPLIHRQSICLRPLVSHLLDEPVNVAISGVSVIDSSRLQPEHLETGERRVEESAGVEAGGGRHDQSVDVVVANSAKSGRIDEAECCCCWTRSHGTVLDQPGPVLSRTVDDKPNNRIQSLTLFRMGSDGLILVFSLLI